MKTILHHQNVSHLAKDIFVIDGIVSEYGKDSKQLSAIEVLRNNKYRVKKIFIPYDLLSNASPSIEIHLGWKDIVIKTASLTKDEKGRLISYEYYNASYENPKAVIESYVHDVEAAGLEINKADIDVLKWILETFPLEKKIMIGVLCVCIGLPIIVGLFK